MLKVGMIIRFEYGIDGNWVIGKITKITGDIVEFVMYNEFNKRFEPDVHQVVLTQDRR